MPDIHPQQDPNSQVSRLAVWTGSLLERLLAAPWLSYLLIAALQFKVIWGIWIWRDMTGGDTSSYFRAATLWSQSLTTNPVWSPLYTAFYGTVHMLTEDVDAIVERASRLWEYIHS